MSVVGFDVGNQTSHVGIARHGGVEIVNNEYSDRKNPSIVGLSHKQRCMGLSAKNQQVMNCRNTVWGFKLLVGRKFSDPVVQEEAKEFPFEVVQQPNDGVGIKVSYSGEDHVFSPEQVMAMMLTYLKKTTEKSISKPVADCVISVPSYFTDAQRRGMLDAASIAGLNCLRLMNDTTATALAYGIYKQDLPAENEKARNVAFVDMGHSSLQVAICAFQKGKLKVLSKAFDPRLGGRNFNQRVVQHFAKEFDKKYKIDSLGHPRRRLRIMNEVEKLIKNLSANTTPIPINIDCFADDKDVAGHMKRDDFTELCADLLERVKAPLQDALAKSRLKVEDIDAVEVVGGSCRVPAIKNAISAFFHREVSMTINMDEAVARGCALQCAMLSPTFKVRDFSIADTQPYPIRLKWKAAMEGEEGEMRVFKEGDPIYHSKVLSFYRKEPFELDASYEFPDQIPYPNPNIGRFRIKDVSPTEEGDAIKVKVKVRMNIHGVFFVKSATMVEKVKVVEESMETEPPATEQPAQQTASAEASSTAPDSSNGPPPPPPPPSSEEPRTDDTDTPAQAQQASEDTPPSQNSTGGQEQVPEATPTEATPSEPAAAEKESPKTEKKANGTKPPEAKKPKKPTVKYVELPIEDRTASMTKHEIDRAHEKEVNMDYQDQQEKERADAKNAVEEYVYNMRGKIEYEYKEFISSTESTKFLQLLNATEEWLYDEGDDQPKKVYVARMKELTGYGDPVVERVQEFGDRPVAFSELGSLLVHYDKILEQYDAGDEQYNHIDAAEMDKVKTAVKSKREWMNVKMNLVTKLPKHATPPVKSSEIRAEKQNLDSECKPIVTKPKPKVEPPKDEGAKAEGEGSQDQPAGEGEGEAKPPEATEEGETKMEEDQTPAPAAEQGESEDMDLD